MLVRAFLIATTLTLCAPRSFGQVDFTIEQAQTILDSLEARGDWQQAAIFRAIQAERTRQHHVADSTLAAQQQATCDSTLKVERQGKRELINENDKLKGRAWYPWAAGLLAFILGVLIGK